MLLLTASPVRAARVPHTTAMTAAVQRWAHAQGSASKVDPLLVRIAKLAMEELQAPVGSDFAALRTLAWQQGWRDAGLVALDVDAAISREALTALLQKTAHAANRVGVAARGSRCVVLLATQHLKLDRVPSYYPRTRNIAIGGRVLGKSASLWGVVGLPNGAVQQLTITRTGSRFATHFAAATPGRYEVQLLVDKGRGPEIAAHFPIGVAVSPWTETTLPHSLLPLIPAPADHAERLRELVQAWRKQHGAAALDLSPSLDTAARRHAEDMRDHDFFGHTSPTTGDVRQRLRHLGVKFERVTENLAAVSGDDPSLRAMTRWIDSPAHRANLLDSNVRELGVAVVAKAQGEFLVVAVLSR